MPEQPTRPRAPGRPRGRSDGGRVTYERIVEEAVELFATRGFHATGVADIGRQVDLTPGPLYYHIGSKKDLLWRILRDYTEVALAGAERISTSANDPVAKLGEMIEFHVETIATHRREVLIQMRDADALSGAQADELHRLRRRVQDCWQRVLDDGARAGQLRAADRGTVNALLGMLNMVATWYRPDRGDTPRATARTITSMILFGLVVDRS